MSLTLPEASRAACPVSSKSCPAPSATTTTAWARLRMRWRSAARKPRLPSSLKGTSGTRVKFTSWLATVAPAAMNPAWRPMSLTKRDAVVDAPRLGVGAVEDFGRFLDRGQVAEGARHEGHIVVNGLGNAHHRQRVSALLAS